MLAASVTLCELARSTSIYISTVLGIRPVRTWMSSRCSGSHGHQSRQPCCYDPQRHYDAQTSWVRGSLYHSFYSKESILRLDPIANNIAAATFGVVNAGKVRTADMGGERHVLSTWNLIKRDPAGSATTSEFTSEVIKNL